MRISFSIKLTFAGLLLNLLGFFKIKLLLNSNTQLKYYVFYLSIVFKTNFEFTEIRVCTQQIILAHFFSFLFFKF